jgi:hypothetical protein
VARPVIADLELEGLVHGSLQRFGEITESAGELRQGVDQAGVGWARPCQAGFELG